MMPGPANESAAPAKRPRKTVVRIHESTFGERRIRIMTQTYNIAIVPGDGWGQDAVCESAEKGVPIDVVY